MQSGELITTIEEFYAISPDADGWRRLPNGNIIRIGDGASIGDRTRIGAEASIGDRTSIGAWARIGDGTRIGAEASIGAGARIGDGARIGAEARIGAWASDAIDLGWFEGYRKTIAQINGVAHIGAGCRWFTLAAAKEYWKDRADRPLTRAMLELATEIARRRGWLEEAETVAVEGGAK